MTNPKRRKEEDDVKTEEGDETSSEETMEDSGESDSETSDDLINTNVNIDFEAFSPDESDFHGVKKLLQQLFRNAHINLSDLTGLILEQKNLSVVLKQADDEGPEQDEDDMEIDDEVYGVSTLVALNQERECIRQIQEYLCENVTEPSDRKKLESCFKEQKVGLLISERFVNIPPRIALPMYESLAADWETVKKTKKQFGFSHLLLISKQYRGKDEIVYANGEEELFEGLAESEFTYDVPVKDADTALTGKWKDGDEELKQIRKVVLLEATAFPRMISELRKHLN